MKKCRFCEIIENTLERKNEEIIFENDNTIVILDRYRQTSVGGICLIIPKKHKSNLLQLDEKESVEIIKMIKFVGEAMQKAYSIEGIRVWTAINKEAGQSIFHCHIHLVPCKSFWDRLIASFPGIYDKKNKILTFGKNELNKKLRIELAEIIINQIND